MEQRQKHEPKLSIIPTNNPDEFEKRLAAVQKLFAKYVKRIIDSNDEHDKLNITEVH